jgi:hypothetical protein
VADMYKYSTPIKAKNSKINTDLINNYRIFPSDYFSGCDMAIYIGDTFIDEITGIQFSMQENILPIYGYADYRYRELVHGNRIVNGSFSINFKESAYIYAIMERLRRGKNNENLSGGLATNQEWTMKDVEQLYSEWMNKNKQSIPTGNYDTFETLADYYEHALWGDPESTFSPLDMDFAVLMRERRTSPFFNVPFTITITYGNVPGAFEARDNNTYRDVLKNKQYRPGSVLLPIEETVKTIVGVHLCGVSQSQDLSGNPCQEIYQFMAQDLDNFDDLIARTPAQ